jgi:tetratricopeptide (TPR) repeat protein
MTPDRYTPAVGYAEYVTRANAAMKEPSFGKAEAFYAAAMTMDPDRPAALFGRIHALLADYRYLEADLILERALKAHPEWAKDAPDLRAVYVKAGVYDRIVEDLREELKRRPGNVPSGLVLGYVLYASGQYDEAKSLLTQVAATRPEAPGPEKVLLEAIEAAGVAKPAKP